MNNQQREERKKLYDTLKYIRNPISIKVVNDDEISSNYNI